MPSDLPCKTKGAIFFLSSQQNFTFRCFILLITT